MQPCAESSAGLFNNGFSFAGLLVKHAVTVRFQNAGFFCSDLRDRVAENPGVIQPDVHDHAGLRIFYAVGGVIPPAESGFQHRNFTVLCGKPEEGAGCHHLKSRGVLCHGICGFPDGGGMPCQHLIFDLPSVDLHALVEAVQIGGGEEPRAVPCGFQHRGGHCSAASFPVGPCDVDSPEGFLRVAERG